LLNLVSKAVVNTLLIATIIKLNKYINNSYTFMFQESKHFTFFI